MGRPPCCDKSTVKKGLWTAEEDAKLLAHISTHGTGNWTSVPKRAGLKRCGKSCRLRWTNYLRPNLKHESFTAEEEEKIIAIHATIGSRWSIIANQLPGRTDNDVKNYWNTKLSKKLCRNGIDPVTHRPISFVMQSIQELQNNTAAAGSASRSCSTTSRHKYAPAGSPQIGCCFDRDLKNVVFLSRPALTTNTASGSIPSPPNPSPQLRRSEAASCCSAAATAPKATAPPPPSPEFKWTDFLVESILSNDDDDSHANSLLDASSMNAESKIRLVTGNNNVNCCLTGELDYGATEGIGASCEISNSFLDAILEQDRELVPKFYELLGDPNDFSL